MMKLVKGFGLFAVLIAAISIGNNVVLLNLHPFTYYYTLEGMKLTAIVCGIETVLVLLLVKPLFRLVVGDKTLIKMGLEHVEDKEE